MDILIQETGVLSIHSCSMRLYEATDRTLSHDPHWHQSLTRSICPFTRGLVMPTSAEQVKAEGSATFLRRPRCRAAMTRTFQRAGEWPSICLRVYLQRGRHVDRHDVTAQVCWRLIFGSSTNIDSTWLKWKLKIWAVRLEQEQINHMSVSAPLELIIHTARPRRDGTKQIKNLTMNTISANR